LGQKKPPFFQLLHGNKAFCIRHLFTLHGLVQKTNSSDGFEVHQFCCQSSFGFIKTSHPSSLETKCQHTNLSSIQSPRLAPSVPSSACGLNAAELTKKEKLKSKWAALDS